MWKSYLLVLALAASIVSCNTNAQSGAGLGAIAGAIAGQAIGHDTEATLIGAAIGGMLGYGIGNEMDKADQAKISHAYETIPDQQSSHWVNPNTGNEFSVTPSRTFKEESGRDCREAVILATIDGKAEKITQTACRDAQGNWHTR